MIIGLAGKKQVGKSTLAKTLVGHGFKEYSFAHPIKLALSAMLNKPYSWFDDQETKELPMPEFNNLSARMFMQTLGTEWGRHIIHPDLWLMVAKQHLTPEHDWVISDIRFENEAQMIRDLGGIVIHIERDNNDSNQDNHASESGVEHKPEDVHFINGNQGSDDMIRFWELVTKIKEDRLLSLTPDAIKKHFHLKAKETGLLEFAKQYKFNPACSVTCYSFMAHIFKQNDLSIWLEIQTTTFPVLPIGEEKIALALFAKLGDEETDELYSIWLTEDEKQSLLP
ncbi:MAG: hypothetical protein K0U21_03510 [Proteobacteria bacterium]|nr:hypothetical protein [Pseudomonadota bacterium]